MKNILTILLAGALGVAAHAQTSDSLQIITMYAQPIVRFDKPLCFLDGKRFSVDSLNVIDPNSIESIYIVKGIEAKEKYGDEGKHGVLLINRKAEGKKED